MDEALALLPQARTQYEAARCTKPCAFTARPRPSTPTMAASSQRSDRRLASYFDFYNRVRNHQLDGMRPYAAHFASASLNVAA